MTRRHDWEFLLVEFAQAQLGRPFRWGETDCFSLAREALGVVHDPNPLEDVPHYFDRESAASVLHEAGHPADALRARGATLVPLGMAQQGDLLVPHGDGHDGLARFAVVVDGRGHVLTSSAGAGVELVAVASLPEGSLAWRWP